MIVTYWTFRVAAGVLAGFSVVLTAVFCSEAAGAFSLFVSHAATSPARTTARIIRTRTLSSSEKA